MLKGNLFPKCRYEICGVGGESFEDSMQASTVTKKVNQL